MFYPDGWDDDLEDHPGFLIMMDDFMGMGQNMIGHDFDYDDDDDEPSFFDSDYDGFSDSDSDFSDRDDLHKVFHTLQDSFTVLPQIEFQRSLGAERLPRVTPGKPETYEALHQVLVEVELLLRTLKKRTEHPFTAHLQKDEKTVADGAELSLGVDYSDEDYDDYEYYQGNSNGPKQLCNETLTKKKYCQSAKLFFSIFKDEEDYSETLSLVRRIRKTVFSILFNIFLDAFPQDVKERLPTELWEKIWLMTQRPFKEGFKAGTRAVEKKYILLEKRRITDVFGAAGNLHMILFEVLFKNPYILKTPPLVELYCLSGKGAQNVPYARSIFSNCKSQLVAKFYRLSVLDNVPGVSAIRLSSDPTHDLIRPNPAREDDASSVDTESVESVLSEDGIVNKIRQGIWTLESSTVDDESTLKLLSLAQNQQQSKALPIFQDYENQLAHFTSFVDQSSAKICLFNTKTQRTEQEIRFELEEMLEAFFDSERSENKRFCVFEDSFTCVNFGKNAKEYDGLEMAGDTDDSAEKEKSGIAINLNRWTKPTMEIGAASADHEIESWIGEKHELEVNLDRFYSHIFQLDATRLKNGSLLYLININHLIIVYDPEKRQIIFKKEDPDADYVIDGLVNGRALVRSSSSIEFLSLDDFKVLETFDFDELSKKRAELCGEDSTSEKLSFIRAKFDCNPERKQFVIFSKNLNFYQLMGYSTEEGFAKPSVLYCGSTHAYDLYVPSTLKQAILMNGLLFVSNVSEVQLVYEALDDLMCYPDDPDPRCASIAAYDLKSLKTLDGGLPIASLIRYLVPKERPLHSTAAPLLNGNVSGFEFDQDRFVPFFVSDDRMLVSIDRTSFLVLDFSKTSREVAEIEAQKLYEEQTKIEEEKRQKEEATLAKQEKQRLLKEKKAKEKKEKLERLIEKYADKTLSGHVDSWHGGFGFIRGEGESRELSTAFVHISAFVNRTEHFIQSGSRVEYKVQYDPERTNFRATWAKIVQNNPGDHQGGRGRGRGHGRGRGGYRGRGGHRGGAQRSDASKF